ncbi:MAG: hypothetical protein Ta2B_30150 [Termitinemataceae bacterium]|nr:MAG: hypothetical protein Ta2B_30150 [Termitinemataceae bacterium]
MNMNRAAVDAALIRAGNLPLTDDDKKYNNHVYRLIRQLYLPVLFTSLTESEWKCARKYAQLKEVDDHSLKQPNMYYYHLPADCIKPIYVDENNIDYHAEQNYIITPFKAQRLYYVFHNRNYTKHLGLNSGWTEPSGIDENSYPFMVSAPLKIDELLRPGAIYHVPKDLITTPVDDDFPEWDYTPYDQELWEFFSCRLAARLIPRLRTDDGTGQRAMAMQQTADQLGEKAIARERSMEMNKNPTPLTWSEKLGLRAGYHDTYWRPTYGR